MCALNCIIHWRMQNKTSLPVHQDQNMTEEYEMTENDKQLSKVRRIIRTEISS